MQSNICHLSQKRQHISSKGEYDMGRLKTSFNRKDVLKMFSDTLSASVLRLLNEQKLSYESAAELCDISSRNMGNIIRRRVQPKLQTVEKLCQGLHVTPNELLLANIPAEKVTVQLALRGGDAYYPVCPGCEAAVAGDLTRLCVRCGHRPERSDRATVLILLPGND